MKRSLSLLLAVIIILSAVSFCSCSGGTELYTSGSGELKIVCTVFPIFDIAMNLAGEAATVTLLQDNGADPHSYTPTAAALKAVSEADIFVFIGGPSDSEWALEMIEASGNSGLKAVRLSHYAGDLIVPETSCDWSDTDHDHKNEESFDDHFWSSPKLALGISEAIASALGEKDPQNAALYTENRVAYTEKLAALSEKYENAFANASAPLLVFADRFPFVYLFRDYKFAYLAAFGGCSTETDSSYETLDIICKSVRTNSLKAVLVIEGSDKKLAEAVSKQTGCDILTVNSLQSVSRSQIDGGLTYIETMEKNLEIFREALEIK